MAVAVGWVMAPALPDESGMVPVGNETDFLTVAFLRHAQSQPPGNPPDLFLAVFADGEHQPREKIPSDAEQRVGLVFRLVAGAAERDLAPGAEKGDSPHLPERPEGCFAQMGTVPFFQCDKPRVMSGGHVFRSQTVGILEQPAELKPRVADYARVRCAAGGIFADEVIDDPVKIPLKVYRVEGDF